MNKYQVLIKRLINNHKNKNMNLSTLKIKSFSLIIAEFLIKSRLAKDPAQLLTITSFNGVINASWIHEIMKKYIFIKFYFSGIPFIFLRNLFNLVNKSSVSPAIIYRQIHDLTHEEEKIKSTEDKFHRYFFNFSHFIQNLKFSWEKLLLFPKNYSIDDLSSLPINVDFSEVNNLTNISTQTLIQKFQKSLLPEFKINKHPMFSSKKLLQNLKANQKILFRLLSTTKIFSSNASYLQPASSDFSETKNSRDELDELKIKKTVDKAVNGKNNRLHPAPTKSSCFEPMVTNFSKLIIRRMKDILQSNVSSIMNVFPVQVQHDKLLSKYLQQLLHEPFSLMKKEVARSHSKFPQSKYIPGKQKEADLGFNEFNLNWIDLIHTRAANITSSAHFSKEQALQMTPFEDSRINQNKIESTVFPDKAHQAIFNSSVMFKIADQVSNILERRVFIEKERRGF